MFSLVRRLLALPFRRGARSGLHDPADMGTAFGLDATTILQPETPDEAAAREQAAAVSRFEHRLHRRSSV